MKSKFLTVNQREWIKGLLIVVIAAALTTVEKIIECNGFNFENSDYHTILIVGIGAGIAYIKTTWLSNSRGEILKPENNIKENI